RLRPQGPGFDLGGGRVSSHSIALRSTLSNAGVIVAPGQVRQVGSEACASIAAATDTRGAIRMVSPFYTAEHEAYREVVRRFVEKEIAPCAHEWDEAGGFPRLLYEKAAAIGLLGLGLPEEYGGVAADQFMKIVASQELAP